MEQDCSDTEALTKPQKPHMRHRQTFSQKYQNKTEHHQQHFNRSQITRMRSPMISSKLTRTNHPQKQQQIKLQQNDNGQALQAARVAHLAQLIIEFVKQFIDQSNLLTETMASAITQYIHDQKLSAVEKQSKQKFLRPIKGNNKSSLISQFSPNIATRSLFTLVFKPTKKSKVSIVQSPDKTEKTRSLQYLVFLHKKIWRYLSQHSERKDQMKLKTEKVRFWYWNLSQFKHEPIEDRLKLHLLQQAVHLPEQHRKKLFYIPSMDNFFLKFFSMFDPRIRHHILLDNVSEDHIYCIKGQYANLEKELGYIVDSLQSHAKHIILLFNGSYTFETKTKKVGWDIKAELIELDKVISHSQIQWKSFAFRLLFDNLSIQLSNIQVINGQLIKQEFNNHKVMFDICHSTCSYSIIKEFCESRNLKTIIEGHKSKIQLSKKVAEIQLITHYI